MKTFIQKVSNYILPANKRPASNEAAKALDNEVRDPAVGDQVDLGGQDGDIVWTSSVRDSGITYTTPVYNPNEVVMAELVEPNEVVTAELVDPKEAAQAEESTKKLIANMKPYIKGIHVVSPAKNGAPAILGGQGQENPVNIPKGLSPMPGKRWVVTPSLEAAHQRRLDSKSNEQLREESQELKTFIAPILAQRYGESEDTVAVELGPAISTDLAKALKSKGSLYFGMDLSKPFLERARDLINEPGYQIADSYQVHGNTYQMPFEDNVADVVCVSCHNPFVSATPSDKIRALAEVKRVLKPGGEFALFPWYGEEKHPAVQEFLFDQFDLVESHAQTPGRDLLILKAKTEQK